MKRAVLAIMTHCVPSEGLSATRQHRFCLAGRLGASGRKTSYVAHTYTGANCLPPCFLPLLKPIFIRLSDNALLTRVLDGYIQNPNESLHSVMWKKCPKHILRGPKSVCIPVHTAVMQYNGGFHSQLPVMAECDLPVLRHSETFATANDTQWGERR